MQLTEPDQGQGERSRSSGASKPSPVRARGGEQRGRDGEAAAAVADLTAPGSSSAPAAGLGRLDPRAGQAHHPADGAQRSRLPSPQPLTPARRPKQLRPSSNKQAAGGARPGRGLRVPRKPQAAQVEPGRRHRKSRVSSLPFLRGDPVTRKRELLPSDGGGGGQRGSRPPPARGSSGPAVQSEARAQLPPAAGRGRVHRQPGGGRRRLDRAPGGEAGGGRAGGGGANASRPPCPRPPGALRRPAERDDDGGDGDAPGLPEADGCGSSSGLREPAWPRCQSARAPGSCFAQAPPARLAGRGSLRSPAERRPRARASGHPAPALERLRTSALRFQPSLRGAPRRYRLGADGTRASWRPPRSPEKLQPQDFSTFFFPRRLVVTGT
ncbi:hypothetical protein ACRRTK_017294 [Alexandromys fortis]